MSYYTVTTNLPPAPEPSMVKIIAWLALAYAVCFIVARAVLA